MPKKMKSGRERRKTDKKNLQKSKYICIYIMLIEYLKLKSPFNKYYLVVLLWVSFQSNFAPENKYS